MKIYNKSQLEGKGLAESGVKERQMLLELDHPYILNLHYAFHTSKRLYFILDCVKGGDLFGKIK